MSQKRILSSITTALITCLLLVAVNFVQPNTLITGTQTSFAQSTQPVIYEDPVCDLRQLFNSLEIDESSERAAELTSLYRTLLGIRDELNSYAQGFRNNSSDYINLFPLAYYHVTKTELDAIQRRNFQHPEQKMEQMILFFDAYKVNRINWDNAIANGTAPENIRNVEEHWKRHFLIAQRESRDWFDFSWDDREVLNTAIEAHVEFDLPRALFESFKKINSSELNNDVFWQELSDDFQKTRQTLDTAFDNVMNEPVMDYNWANDFGDWLIDFSGHDFNEVIRLRNEAWKKARTGSGIIEHPQPKIEDHSEYEKAAEDKYCGTTEPDPRNGPKKRGRNFGDPHLFTFDGYRYSFQLVGEFVLTKSDDRLFEVQVRQSPLNSSLSIDSAIAMRMGGDRVALYASELPDADTSTPLRVNGNPVVVNREQTLRGGGKVFHNGRDYVFVWPTGEEVVAQINDSNDTPFINITAYTFESQANHLTGLLGNANGDVSDELRFRSGELLPSQDAYGDITSLIGRNSAIRLPLDAAFNFYLESLSTDYGNDWRVSEDESLFDYAPGQTTQTFTLSSFPSEYLALEQLSSTELSSAQSACIERDVEPDLMEGCVFDVAFSGRSDFARAAARVAQTADILRQFGIDVPDIENIVQEEILDRIPGLPGGIRIPGLPF